MPSNQHSNDHHHQALVDALMEDPEIKAHLTREKILDALEPIKYTGTTTIYYFSFKWNGMTWHEAFYDPSLMIVNQSKACVRNWLSSKHKKH